MQSVNPATGESIQHYNEHTLEAARKMARRAHDVAESWARTSLQDRAALLLRLERSLLDSRDDLADLMAREMGKPIAEGRGEIEKCAKLCRYYAERGP
ncbi:MAG TPA: aldehyde dehydrogenase family protein, partial [Polyangiaceae bacterium]|nr:aldehyde dehydrogenase family protein [Polyangiaceae bacterium]